MISFLGIDGGFERVFCSPRQVMSLAHTSPKGIDEFSALVAEADVFSLTVLVNKGVARSNGCGYKSSGLYEYNPYLVIV